MCQHAKIQLISSIHYWDFRVPRPKRSCTFLITTTQKLLKLLLAFLDFYQHTKDQFILLIPSWGKDNFRVLGPHPFLTMSTPTFLDQLLISMNLYQYTKNEAFSSFCSRDTVDLKILQSDWPRAFCPISQEVDFSQIRDLCNDTGINLNFLNREIQKKLMNKFSNKFKLAHFPHFWGKSIFSQNTMLSFRKNWWANPKKTSGREDGQTRIHRTLPVTTVGSKIACFYISFYQKVHQSQTTEQLIKNNRPIKESTSELDQYLGSYLKISLDFVIMII